MVHPGEAIIAIAALSAAAISIKVVVSGILRYQENKLRYGNARFDDAGDPRLERLEQAVDAIAIEIERISEGQRFTTKLLSQQRTAQPRVTADLD